MIHIFHGFLGSPEDFSFLEQKNVILHDLYTLRDLHIKPEDTLIGYSMGGRVALELAAKFHFNLKKLVLINAHPGLATEEERLNRKQFENRVIIELENKTKTQFLSMWNSLPIFEHDIPIEVKNDERFKTAPKLFNRFRLSEQKNHLPEMIKHKDKVLYIVGLQDRQYMNLVSNYLLPHDISIKSVSGGHRLFQRSDELKQVLIDEGIL